MARAKVAVLVIIFALSVLSPTEAAEVEELNSGMLFGGLHGLANETIALNSTLDDLPTIAEDYTATWCGQCIAVEDALENVASSSNMQVYSIHRNINDPEDPLGSEPVDAQFRDRYDPFLPWKPPIVGFNGTYAISGNVPVGSSLEADYTEQAAESLNLGTGFVTFAWAPTGMDSGTVSWSIEQSKNSSFNVSIWMVEKVATFPDGTNGKVNYPHVVREIIHLDVINSTGLSQGVQSINYANAYDGIDLEVHLMFHEIVESQSDIDIDNMKEDEDKGGFSGMLISLSVGLLVVIGIISFLMLKKKSATDSLHVSLDNELTLPTTTTPDVPQPSATIEPTILNEWTDETGHTWRKMSDGSGRWWNGTAWQEV
jgi:thiol-disulfide isomerase/thioredoxin